MSTAVTNMGITSRAIDPNAVQFAETESWFLEKTAMMDRTMELDAITDVMDMTKTSSFAMEEIERVQLFAQIVEMGSLMTSKYAMMD